MQFKASKFFSFVFSFYKIFIFDKFSSFFDVFSFSKFSSSFNILVFSKSSSFSNISAFSKALKFLFFFLFFTPYYSWSLIEQEINAKGTYLYVDYFKDFEAIAPTSLLLKDIPAKKEELIELSFYSANKEIKELLGVFSNDKGELIPFKQDFISPQSERTKYSKIPTDIPQDFGILAHECLALVVPKGSDRILFSLNDSYFSNNNNVSAFVKAEKVLFQMKEKTLYQVVPSPKIDLKDALESFDVAKNKTAVLKVLYEILDESYLSTKIFKPVLKINSKSYKPKCFDTINKREKACDFSLSLFDKRGLLEQVIILPMGVEEVLDKEGSYDIELGFEDKACRSDFTSYLFNLNVYETRKLQTAFTLIKSVDLNKWKSFMKQSLLDFDLVKRVYPVADIGSNNPQWIFLNEKLQTDKRQNVALGGNNIDLGNNNNTDNSPNTDNSDSLIEGATQGKVIRLNDKDFNRYTGLLRDLTELKKMRIKQQLDKLFAVADRDYFSNIGKENVAGFVVFTDNASDTENVGFIRIDQGGTGTILHEMGHLLGQLNEFYQKSFKNLEVNDVCEFEGVKDYCFRFKDFKGFYGSLKEDYSRWRFIERESSIMNNSEDLEEQWIDRQTYGKALKTLSDPKLDPELLIFSGIFNKKTFIEPELEYVAEGFLTSDNPKGNLKIKILDGNLKELYSLRISTKLSIEFIDNSHHKPSTTMELTPAPVAVALPYLKEGRKIVVVDEKGDEIFAKALNENTIIRTLDKPDLTNRIVFE